MVIKLLLGFGYQTYFDDKMLSITMTIIGHVCLICLQNCMNILQNASLLRNIIILIY